MIANSHLFKYKNIMSSSHVIRITCNSNLSISHIFTFALSLFNAFLVLKLSLNFIFVGKLCDFGFDVHFSYHDYFVQDS